MIRFFSQTLFRAVKIVVVLLLVALTASPFLLLQKSPLVAAGRKLSPEDLVHIREFIKKNDPRAFPRDEKRRLAVSEDTANLFVTYMFDKLPVFDRANARVEFENHRAVIGMSWRLAEHPPGFYLNARVDLTDRRGVDAMVEEVRIGRVPIPGDLLQFGLRRLRREPDFYEEYLAIRNAVERFRIAEGEAEVDFVWQPEVASRLSKKGRDLILTEEGGDRLQAYKSKLAEILGPLAPRSSLAEVIPPMFSFAAERAGSEQAAIEENRAALVALGLYIGGERLRGIVDPSFSETLPENVKLTLNQRHDLARHFLISAAITVSLDEAVANAVGLIKEIEDAKGRSGFSFTDIAADKAGVKLAQEATGSPRRARAIQLRLSQVDQESEFMPSIAGLQEGLSEASFQEQYRDMHSAAYKRLEQEISRRIDACEIYL